MSIESRLERLERETGSGPCDACGYPHRQRMVVLYPDGEELPLHKGQDQDRTPCPACGREPIVIAVEYSDEWQGEQRAAMY